MLAAEERAASSREEPRAREECGQPGISEECPSAVHLPAFWQWATGPAACHSHNAAAQPRGEEQTGCYCTRYATDKGCVDVEQQKKQRFTLIHKSQRFRFFSKLLKNKIVEFLMWCPINSSLQVKKRGLGVGAPAGALTSTAGLGSDKHHI